jgi:hypothetical protein
MAGLEIVENNKKIDKYSNELLGEIVLRLSVLCNEDLERVLDLLKDEYIY